MGDRGGITEEVITNSVVALGGNDFETGIINVPSGGTISKGVVLKRENGKFAPVIDTDDEDDPDIPVAVNPFDIKNPADTAADLSIRALISGEVRADLLRINGIATTVAQNDMLRDYGIIPVKVNDLSRTE
jgi:hypothetical protein